MSNVSCVVVYLLNGNYAHLITEGWRLVLHLFFLLFKYITQRMWRFCLPLIIFMSGQSLMWAQLHEYKVPCAGISLFTFQIARNYTSVSTFTLITVSPPRVWSAETAQSIEQLVTIPSKKGQFPSSTPAPIPGHMVQPLLLYLYGSGACLIPPQDESIYYASRKLSQ